MDQYKWCAIDGEGDVQIKGLQGVALWSSSFVGYCTNMDAIRYRVSALAESGHTFVAHNARYDLSLIFWTLGIPMKEISYNGRFNRGEWKYDVSRPTCELWDSYALSGGLSLARLGESIGLPKYATPQSLAGRDPNRYQWRCERHQQWECVECYALRDAEIVYRFMQSLDQTCQGWGIKPARRISTMAERVWRALDHPAPCQLPTSAIRRLSRDAYYGGRVETFKLGTISPCHVADIRGMYPSIMATTPYPDPAHLVYVERPAWNAVQWSGEGVADCLVTVPPSYLPPLPLRVGKQLQYPVGRFRGTWTLREIQYAASQGAHVERVYRAVFTTAVLFPFSEFVGVLWAMRKQYHDQGDARELLAKVLMNSLSGRLGMKEAVKRTTIQRWTKRRAPRASEHTNWRVIDGDLWIEREVEQYIRSPYSNVMWAAQTTSEARIRLHRLMLMQGDALLYCDTDSVFSRDPIIGLSDGLGGLGLEGTYQSIIIAHPKLYAVQEMSGQWKATAKGLPRRAALDFLRHGIAHYQEPVSPAQGLRRGIRPGTWIDVDKEDRNHPHRRLPLNPGVCATGIGWTDTTPPVVMTGAPGDLAGTTP